MKPTCIPEKLYESQKDVFDAVIAEVIEACAKVCDELAELNRKACTDSVWQWAECAAAIRARGDK